MYFKIYIKYIMKFLDCMETFLRLGMFFIVILLCIYINFRKKYIEHFLGFSDFTGVYDGKLIDKNVEKVILGNRCQDIEAPGFNCLRVGFYCHKQGRVIN